MGVPTTLVLQTFEVMIRARFDGRLRRPDYPGTPRDTPIEFGTLDEAEAWVESNARSYVHYNDPERYTWAVVRRGGR